MLAYLVRRLAYGFVTVLGVLLLPLRALLPATPRRTTWRARASARRRRPRCSSSGSRTTATTSRLWNPERRRDTLLVEHFRRMLTFDFGRSDADDTPIAQRLREGDGPEPRAHGAALRARARCSASGSRSSSPIFRETYIDRMGVILCVLAMSISTLLYIIGGQFLIGKLLRWFPISGFDPSPAVIAALPGAAGRWSASLDGLGGERALLPHGLHRGDAAATTCARRAPRAAATCA